MTKKKLRKRLQLCQKAPFSITREDLGPYLLGYVEAMLDTSYAESFAGRKSLSWDSVSDIGQPTLAQMMRDALYFYGRNRKFILDKDRNKSQYTAGRRLWLARIGKLRGNKAWYKRVNALMLGHYTPRFAYTVDDKIMQIGPVDHPFTTSDLINQSRDIKWGV